MHIDNMLSDYDKIRRLVRAETGEPAFDAVEVYKNKADSKYCTVLQAFENALHAVGFDGKRSIETVYMTLANYLQDHRHYHTWTHIEHMFCIGRGAYYDVMMMPEAIFAVVLHDVIYDPMRGDNEERSAQFARNFLSPNLRSVEQICQIILATKEHKGNDDFLTRFVLDLDMSIFAESFDDVMEYDANIRKEYKLVPDAIFYDHRLEFLTQLLEEDRIYKTEYFIDNFEQRARVNIQALVEEKYDQH